MTGAEHSLAERLRAVSELIGNTPLLAVHCRFRGQHRTIYAKLEAMNLTGSIKDRMALHILKRAYAEQRISAGDTIAEATSGNTGIALAAVGCALGNPVVIFIPDWMSVERVALLKSYGATVERVSAERGGFLASIDLCARFATSRSRVYLPSQFTNVANIEAHQLTTGPEIVRQIESLGLKVDAFVAGVGTGGTVMGVGRCLRHHHSSAYIHPLEPAESPILTAGTKRGNHRIQGISDEFVPAICRLAELDAVVSVSDGDAILAAQQLATTLGLGVGISSGANFLGALKVQESLGPKAVVVTVFSDDNKKYLSTSLFHREVIMNTYLSPEIELLHYGVVSGRQS